jgi:hypothetical protein
MNRRESLRFTGLAAIAAIFKGCTWFFDRNKQCEEKDMTTNAFQQKRPMIAACGLNCDECSIRKAADDKEFAEKLAAQWRKSGRSEATADWFKCQGCHGPDELVWWGGCKIRSCCIKRRRLSNCSYCSGFPCLLIEEFEKDGYAHHAKAVQHLRSLWPRARRTSYHRSPKSVDCGGADLPK